MKGLSLKDTEMMLVCITASGEVYTSEHFHFASETDSFRNVREREVDIIIRENNLDPDSIVWTRSKRILSDDTVYVSEHALQRMKERAGFSKSAGLRMAVRAYERGTRITPSTAALRHWFARKNLLYNGSTYYTTFIKYGNFLYVYKNTVLITMYPFDEKHIYDHSDRSYRYNRRLANKTRLVEFTGQAVMSYLDEYADKVSWPFLTA